MKWFKTALISLFWLCVFISGCKKQEEAPVNDKSINPFAIAIPSGDYEGDLQFAVTGNHLGNEQFGGVAFFGTLYNSFKETPDSSTPNGGDFLLNTWPVKYNRLYGYTNYIGKDSFDILLPLGRDNKLSVEFTGGPDFKNFKSEVSLVDPLLIQLPAFKDVFQGDDFSFSWNSSPTYPNVTHVWLEYEPGLTGNPPENSGSKYYSKTYVIKGANSLTIPASDLAEFPLGNLRLSVGTGKSDEISDVNSGTKIISITYTKAQSYLTLNHK